MIGKQVFSHIVNVWFYVGVNVIGIPEMVKHETFVYKPTKENNFDKRNTKPKSIKL